MAAQPSYLREASLAGIPIWIDSSTRIEYQWGNKFKEHKCLGDFNFIEYLGRDIDYYRFTFRIFSNDSDDNATNENVTETLWQDLQVQLLSTTPILFQPPDYPQVLVTVTEAPKLKKYRGFYEIEVTLTNAPSSLLPISIAQNTNTLLLLYQTRLSEVNAMSAFTKFKQNTLSKIRAFSAKAENLSNKINSISSNFAAVPTVLDSLNNTLSIVTGNVLGLATSIQAAKNSLLNIPNNLATFTQDIQNVFDAFVNIFSNSNAAIDGLLSLGTIGNDDPAPTNTSKTALDINSNNQLQNALFKTECLANIYNSIANVTFITAAQIRAIQTQESIMYQYVVQHGQTMNTTLLQMRNAYLLLLKQLVQNAVQTQTVNIAFPTSLSNIVYQYNGNLDYYDQTRIYNKIVNTYAVQGSITIFLNQ